MIQVSPTAETIRGYKKLGLKSVFSFYCGRKCGRKLLKLFIETEIETRQIQRKIVFKQFSMFNGDDFCLTVTGCRDSSSANRVVFVCISFFLSPSTAGADGGAAGGRA